MEELTRQQKDIGTEIERIALNYSKTPSTRKSTSLIQSKLEALEQLWNTFETTDNLIRQQYDDRLDHPYFANGYYQQIKTGFDKVCADMNSRLTAHKLSSETSDDPADTGELQWTSQHYKSTTGVQGEATNLPTLREEEENGSKLTTTNTSKQTIPKATGAIPKQATNVKAKSTQSMHSILVNRAKLMTRSLENTLQGEVPGRTEQTCRFYQFKIEMIERQWKELQQLQYNIWEKAAETSSDEENVDWFFELEGRVQENLLYLYESMDSCKQQPLGSVPTLDQTTSKPPAVKLPKVTLPKFEGDYLKWRQFRDLYSELVHKQDIADCHKMWYLKNSLQGEAEKLIRHFTISDSNYQAAWRIINERYENKRLLVNALINKLLSQPTYTVESASAIKAIHDTTQECLLGLQNLSIQTTHWDALLLHILIKKLDRNTHTLWEQSLAEPRALPSMTEFLKFLEIRFQSLEAVGGRPKTSEEAPRRHTAAKVLSSTTTVSQSCPHCKGQHQIYNCERFLKLSSQDRQRVVRSAQLCTNCFKPGHNYLNCASRSCKKCSLKHNTLLHMDPPQARWYPVSSQTKKPAAMHTSSTTMTSMDKRETPSDSASLAAKATHQNDGYVILSTILVKLVNQEGTEVQCRAILDSGSQLNFVTEELANRLRLKAQLRKPNIEGIGLIKHKTSGQATVTLQSRINGFKADITVHILPQIVSPQPSRLINSTKWPIPKNIPLADPFFNKPGPIDLLIGAELYHSILAIGQINLGNELPTLQNTVFGWTVAGKVHNLSQSMSTCTICSAEEQLSNQIQKFWQLEDIEGRNENYTSTEQQCEDHFQQTHQRDADGRFRVRLPMLEDPESLGESKDIAYKRFLSVERRLNANPELKVQYASFIHEYEALGHMELVNFNNIRRPYFFLPHHAVVKPESTTTKLRVVFDGSALTSSGKSLNDILHTGPVIQDDVFSILLRFRLPRYTFTADIEKMYRQIQVDDRDQNLQLIWWRDSPTEKLKCYKLKTVTYGTACAPYLAVKCLQSLAEKHADDYPLALRVVKRNCYVDDVLAGSDKLSEAIETRCQTESLLKAGGFNLRKWCSNHPQLLQGIPYDQQEIQLDLNNESDEHIKTMGLIWYPKSDTFKIRYKKLDHKRITKRTVASDIAHLFDPLGLMSPVIITAKIFSQTLWSIKLDWDAALPQEHHTFWENFKKELDLLNEISIPRHTFSHNIPERVQLHIFTDASEKAFGAAAYLRAVYKSQLITVQLLCAKSKVAPLKQHTLPRLELCAAKLGSELADRIRKDLQLTRENIYFWSDSEIALSWIYSKSSSFHTFVANRVSSIQRLSKPTQWRHVPSKQNPADLISRGLSPENLRSNAFWFQGPFYLHGTESVWPPPFQQKSECTQERRKVAMTATTSDEHVIDAIDHKNSFKRLIRIIAYVRRFKYNISNRKGSSERLEATELHEARTIVLKYMQVQEFKDDVLHLRRYNEVSRTSPIGSLTPFLDHEGLIRVGGRLQASNLQYDSKHPILLPYTHPLTKVIMTELHRDNHHLGPQALLSMTRQTYWPVKGKTLSRSIVQHCVFCSRVKPKTLNQLMGNLPAARIQQSRPFINAGVDFCGPVWVHYKLRGKRPQKAYIAVFCCFATKAVHLEIVSDLTSEGFIGALKRFTSRRGHCRHIYCDNATNFVGAKRQLEEVKQLLESKTAIDKISSICSSKGTDFHMIPPRAPHFGGLWEAAVKSAKHLLQSALAAASMTYEEMETVVTEVEAILNSRPITPISDDPNDLTALTPSHFLIGEPLTAPINAHVELDKTTLVTRWKLVTKLKNEFWRRWHKEYLNHLQLRSKWKHQVRNIERGTMVIIKEENTPPLKWALGRIIETFSGDDGLVRVADVKTSTGIFRRPIHKLAPLPIEKLENEAVELPAAGKELSTISGSPTAATSSTNQKRSSQDQSHQSKRGKMSMGSAIVSLLLTCLFIPGVPCSPVNTTKFENQPGIYFEHLGPANIIASEWNLVVYYDMESYWREVRLLQHHHQDLQAVCKLMENNDACTHTSIQLSHHINELETINKYLLKNPSPGRSKRGAVNIIGNLANALFGVLDSTYADEMSKTIENIEQNEDQLQNLLKNQTSLLDATVNVITRDQQEVSAHLNQLKDQITKITTIMNGIRQENHQQNMLQIFTNIAIQASFLASNLHRIQDTIADVIVNAQHGKLSPQLILPDQLEREIGNIKKHLPLTLKLLAPSDDILQYYNLLSVKGRIRTRHAIFKVTIPLAAADNFELLHILPVPVPFNNTLVAIQPTYPYLMMNLHRDHYYPLTEHELASCILTMNNQYSCKQNHPLYKIGSTICQCEITFLNKAEQSPSCRIVTVEDGPHWIQLQSGNQWIFSLTNKTTINVVCGEVMTQLAIEKIGLLSLQDGCVVNQPLITLQGRKNLLSTINKAVLPASNITDKLQRDQLTPAVFQTRHYVPHLEEISRIKKQLHELDENFPNLHHLNTHHFATSYLCLSVVIIIIGYLIYKCYKGHPTTTGRQPAIEMEESPPPIEFTANFEAPTS